MNETTCYLLHFERPIGNPASRYGWAQHYVGSTSDLDARMAKERDPARCDVKILLACHAEGISWQLARTWDGGRVRERQLKNSHGGHGTRCPVCKGQGIQLLTERL